MNSSSQAESKTDQTLGHYAARFYDLPQRGQIGPQDRNYVIRAKSLAAAKRAAKVIQQDKGHVRLVEVFQIRDDERDDFRRNGWYVNEVFA